MKGFEVLGLDGVLAENGFAGSYRSAHELSGTELFTIPLADTAVKRWGSPYLHIHRADFISVWKKRSVRAVPTLFVSTQM